MPYIAWSIGGGAMVLLGCGGILWRFFKQRSGSALSTPISRPPHYLASCLMVAAGLGLLTLAVTAQFPSGGIPIATGVLAGVALGACLAVPGIVLVAQGQEAVASWYEDPADSARPWRALAGWALIGLAIGVSDLLPIVSQQVS
jgi:hypothetical protein